MNELASPCKWPVNENMQWAAKLGTTEGYSSLTGCNAERLALRCNCKLELLSQFAAIRQNTNEFRFIQKKENSVSHSFQRGIVTLFGNFRKSKKVSLHQLNSKNNGLVLLLKTI